MVSTRHTRPSSDAQPFESTRYATARKGTVSRALRNLVIDGNDGLRGEREANSEPPKEVKVYHWRGAVYAVDENTPDAWIEAQPKRYLKRKRDQEEDEEDEAEDGNKSRHRGRKRKKRNVDGGDNDDDDDGNDNEEDDTDDDYHEDSDEEHERKHRKHYASNRTAPEPEPESQPQPPPQKRGPGRPRKIRRETMPALPTSTPRGHKTTDHRPTTPRSAPAQRGRPRSKPDGVAKPARAKSARRPTTSHPSSLHKTANRLTSAAYKSARRHHAATPVHSELDSGPIAPIPWADMMAGRIAVSMTKFLAVQSQLRKLQQEYALARDLHRRVVAREKERKQMATRQTAATGSSLPTQPTAPLVRSAADTDSSKLGASVQRTDSRLSRREEQAADKFIGSAISLPASDDGQRERASSFDTAPSHAELSPRSHHPIDQHRAKQQAARQATNDAFRAFQAATRSDEASLLADLLNNQDSAAFVLANERRLATETPEEKSRRLNREWDRVMAWPQKTVSK